MKSRIADFALRSLIVRGERLITQGFAGPRSGGRETHVPGLICYLSCRSGPYFSLDTFLRCAANRSMSRTTMLRTFACFAYGVWFGVGRRHATLHALRRRVTRAEAVENDDGKTVS